MGEAEFVERVALRKCLFPSTKVAQSPGVVTTLFRVAEIAQKARTDREPNRLQIVAVIALAIVVALIVWMIVKGDDDDKSTPSAPSASAASLATLRALPGELGHDVYWAGRRPGLTSELTEVNGNTFIRYLPQGIPVGDPRPDYLTVGTYPKANSYAQLKRQAQRRGNKSRPAAGGGLAVWSDGRPQSVYLAYPRADLQIEVYDPFAARARRLVTSGVVKPIR
jgi:hypothetical protein